MMEVARTDQSVAIPESDTEAPQGACHARDVRDILYLQVVLLIARYGSQLRRVLVANNSFGKVEEESNKPLVVSRLQW